MKDPIFCYKLLFWQEIDETDETLSDFAPESGWRVFSYHKTENEARQTSKSLTKSKIIQIIEQELD